MTYQRPPRCAWLTKDARLSLWLQHSLLMNDVNRSRSRKRITVVCAVLLGVYLVALFLVSHK